MDSHQAVAHRVLHGHLARSYGFLVAAKSILRFSEIKESEKSEYVLAGTLVSIAIAIACGIMVIADRL
jgi:hypothetical protein